MCLKRVVVSEEPPRRTNKFVGTEIVESAVQSMLIYGVCTVQLGMSHGREASSVGSFV